ncbi:MAG: VWA domain-containing protein [Prevotellaceae bacterium]|jgi:Ca-activated chloride channel family protein|nr:VWA domain-containing protein [Prevotellaceae bacterium]
MTFQNPLYLLLLLLIIPLVLWYVMRKWRRDTTLKMSSLQIFEQISDNKKLYWLHLPFVLRMIAVVMTIFVLARPQTTKSWQNQNTEGIDIMMAMDISSSMLAEDLKPNRLKAAKNVAIEFITSRPNDNIGLVLYASESFTLCPLTTDHSVLINLFNSVDFGMLKDGTAIGSGLATAVSRIKDSKMKSKVIILLTDGSNNAGDISPETAAEIARKMNIRVYTIGVGTRGKAPFPFETPFGIQYQNIDVDIDEAMLKTIATLTDGAYFRATDNNKLKEIYAEIDKLEKTKFELEQHNKRNEAYFPFALIALLCIFSEIILRNTILKKIP